MSETSAVVVMMPKAIPSELLTIWAMKPTRLTASNDHMSLSLGSKFGGIVERNSRESILKETILHIGLEKTGTTSIQYLLSQNRELLLKSGCLVSASSNSGNNYHLAIASYAKFRNDGLTKQLGIKSQQELDAFRAKKLKALQNEILETKPQKVILTSEHFQSRLLGPQDIQLLKTSLESIGLKNFKVLLYLRDPLKIVMSHHGMAIKKGVHVTDDFYRPEHPRISHIIDHQKTLQNWQAVFGRDAMDVRIYPEGRGGDVLLNDFLQACEIPSSALDMSKQEVRNINLSASALTALNRINASSNKVRVLAEDRWLFHKLEKQFPGRGLNPSQATIELFETWFSAAHSQIAKDWFSADRPLFGSDWTPDVVTRSELDQEVANQVEALVNRAMRRHRLISVVSLPRRILRRLVS